MERVTLGRSGLEVSVMGLGAGGDSRLGVRKKTTFGGPPLDERAVTDSLHESLRRLGTDYVDVYHLHGVAPGDYEQLSDRIVPVLLRLRQQGKLRFLGITEKFVDDPEHQMLQRALRDDVWDVVMVGFNLLNQSARRRVFSSTLARNVGTLIMFAVRRALSQPARLHQLLRELSASGRLNRAEAEAGLAFLTEPGVAETLPEAAYRYCRHEPGAHVVLSGTSSPSHLLDNIAALSRPALPAAALARLAELFDGIDHLSGQ